MKGSGLLSGRMQDKRSVSVRRIPPLVYPRGEDPLAEVFLFDSPGSVRLWIVVQSILTCLCRVCL